MSFAHLIRRLDEVPVGKVSVTGCGPAPLVPEQAADQGQVLAGHDGMAGIGVAKIVKTEVGQTRLGADATPMERDVGDGPRGRAAREEPGTIHAVARDVVDDRAGGARQPVDAPPPWTGGEIGRGVDRGPATPRNPRPSIDTRQCAACAASHMH